MSRALDVVTLTGEEYDAMQEAIERLRELLEEIARLREGLRLITCESVNAEYMAQNILDGLPAYHDTMLVPNETPNAK